MANKRERSVDEINAIIVEKYRVISKLKSEVETLQREVKGLEQERVAKRNPNAISVEKFVSVNGIGLHERQKLGELIRAYWGNGVDEKHVTLNGKNIFDTVSNWLDKNVEDSDGIVCLMFPSLTLKMKRREDLTEKEISKMINDPDAILVFSK